MNVLSLFDGMSCGQIALKELGLKVDNYYASEIDKFAIQQTQHNFPNTIQLGSVTDIKAKDLPKIDLLIGGSPCQGFSFAGKQLAFNDPRSVLFFEYVRLWDEIKTINPNAKFLLENVNMKKNELRIISEYLGLFPININSNLVSAQKRNRWYWSNIKTKDVGLFSELWTDIPHPQDKGILLKDILQPESEIDKKYYLKYAAVKYLQRNHRQFGKDTPAKRHWLLAGYGYGIAHQFVKLDKQLNKKSDQNKAGCLTGGGNSGGNHSDMDIIAIGCVKFGRSEEGKRSRKKSMKKGKDHTPFQAKEIVSVDFDKMNTLTTATTKDNILTDGYKFRRLTPIECSRLQTIPEWYEWVVSDTQIYRMLGNGWTVSIIEHIFSFIQTTKK